MLVRPYARFPCWMPSLPPDILSHGGPQLDSGQHLANRRAACQQPGKISKDRHVTLIFQIQHLTDDATHDLSDLDKTTGRENTAAKVKPDLEITEKNFTHRPAKYFIDDLNNRIQDRHAKLNIDKAPLLAQTTRFRPALPGLSREANTALCRPPVVFPIYRTLPDGTAIATLHFVHK